MVEEHIVYWCSCIDLGLYARAVPSGKDCKEIVRERFLEDFRTGYFIALTYPQQCINDTIKRSIMELVNDDRIDTLEYTSMTDIIALMFSYVLLTVY